MYKSGCLTTPVAIARRGSNESAPSSGKIRRSLSLSTRSAFCRVVAAEARAPMFRQRAVSERTGAGFLFPQAPF